MRALTIAALVVGLTGLAGLTRADDKKADPSGTWKYTTERGGKQRETVLKLKAEGDKLTGTVSSGKGEAKIEDGTVKGGDVTFSVTREGKDQQKFTIKYKAKVEGDVMKGTAEGSFGGKDFKQEFEAKREKGDK